MKAAQLDLAASCSAGIEGVVFNVYRLTGTDEVSYFRKDELFPGWPFVVRVEDGLTIRHMAEGGGPGEASIALHSGEDAALAAGTPAHARIRLCRWDGPRNLPKHRSKTAGRSLRGARGAGILAPAAYAEKERPHGKRSRLEDRCNAC